MVRLVTMTKPVGSDPVLPSFSKGVNSRVRFPNDSIHAKK